MFAALLLLAGHVQAEKRAVAVRNYASEADCNNENPSAPLVFTNSDGCLGGSEGSTQLVCDGGTDSVIVGTYSSFDCSGDATSENSLSDKTCYSGDAGNYIFVECSLVLPTTSSAVDATLTPCGSNPAGDAITVKTDECIDDFGDIGIIRCDDDIWAVTIYNSSTTCDEGLSDTAGGQLGECVRLDGTDPDTDIRVTCSGNRAIVGSTTLLVIIAAITNME